MTLETDLIWPVARVGEALHALATHARLRPCPLVDVDAPDESRLGPWIETLAAAAGVGVESVETTYADADRFLAAGAPALLRLGAEGIVALVKGKRDAVWILASDGASRKVPRATLRAALVDDLERPVRPDVDALLAAIDVPEGRRDVARAALLAERLSTAIVGDAWLVRTAEGADVRARLRRSRIPARIAALLAAHATEYGLWLVAWALLGRALLGGRLDAGWLVAWLLLLVTIVPLRALGTWLGSVVTIEAGGLLRRRLLAGALRLAPEEVRHRGVGQLLGQVLEADVIDALALGGGLLTMTATIELVVVFTVSVVAGELLLAGALVLWLVVVLLLARRLWSRRAGWTDVRLGMTHDLVERMVGHRTRQAQESPAGWHDAEDQMLEQYLARARPMDAAAVALDGIVSRGWLIVGLLAVAPSFVAGAPAAALAVALGAVILAARALHRVALGVTQLIGAMIAWRQIAPLFAAANRPLREGTPIAHAVAAGSAASRAGVALLEAHDLAFRHQGRESPVLQSCSLSIATGDRILLEGASGAGKSTLGALLLGLREPDTGVLLLNGLDRPSLGARAWRRRIAGAPQFHENHVLSATFLFNALLGTDAWPPRRRDLEEVEAVCGELGLGDLLSRMPAGLFQMVGETGWQLSHGERSRLYVARALLQRADLIVLDESFAALDPENLARALQCVLARARTLLVIAHP